MHGWTICYSLSENVPENVPQIIQPKRSRERSPQSTFSYTRF